MTRTPERLLAIDWMRGLVMVLMALDHVDHATNPNHAQGDGAMFPAGGPLSAPDFTLRWLTHLCAPTFVLLAGMSVALSAANARDRGASAWQIDRHLLARGLVILGLEFTLVSMYWRIGEGAPAFGLPVFPQVLWAIGGGLVLMPLLRRLPAGWLLGTSIGLLVLGELWRAATLDTAWEQPLAVGMMVTGGGWWWDGDRERMPDVITLYPLLPWLPAMLAGVVLGRLALAGRLTPRLLFGAGFASLALFLLLRGVDGFGNMGYHRRSLDVLEWLHCSKYPPSITFFAVELGLAVIVLGALMTFRGVLERVPDQNPLAVLGRVPMFFYLLHLPMIGALMGIGLLPGRGQGSAAMSLLGTMIVVVACWPLCGAYGWYKRRHRHAWTRYL